jgi:DNA-binding HxlR family transcriptional regulator
MIEMDDTFDREKVIDCMFDPITSSILAELEDGEKECSVLAEKTTLSESEVLERLSYLIKHEFIFKNIDNGKSIFSANTEKLTQIIENSDTFSATIEGLEKMDSYLN